MSVELETPQVFPCPWGTSDGKRLLSGNCRVVGRCVIEGRVGAVIGFMCEDDDGLFATYWVAGADGGYFVVIDGEKETSDHKRTSRKKTEDTTPAGRKRQRRGADDAD